MQNILLITLIATLATVGGITIITTIIEVFAKAFLAFPKKSLTIVSVLNAEEDIELIARSIIFNTINKNYGQEILLINKNNNFETNEVLSRLANDYDFIHIADKENYIYEVKKIIEKN